ncbi:MAG: prepilin-type N-terminal cleavage/methylation domain-containing protein [Candidatus Omnitrophica bacterium]|nr:prepilin-type N-terminal cleavage/methylation domain-containing protein [Candidatus Omnitrophota bacterium]
MKRGFTLVEVMVVVIVLMILVSLSIPNILRSRVVAYEGTAISNLKTLSNACQIYHANVGYYPDNIDALTTTDPPYVDTSFGSNSDYTKQRYKFEYDKVNADSFTINANSVSSGLLKGRYFFIDETGIIRANSDKAAGPKDESIE